MAKNFPYFKFIATEWLTGDIVYESFEAQGLFINICALYWQRDGKLSVEDISKRYKTELYQTLTDRFFSVNDGFISISFLDEQLIDANHTSKVNSENGKKGGRPKLLETLENKPTANRPLSEIKQRKEKKNNNKRKEKEIEIPSCESFVSFAVENKPKVDVSKVALKYSSWIANDWKDGNDNKINNWKSKLLNTLPYIDELKKEKYDPTNPKHFFGV